MSVTSIRMPASSARNCSSRSRFSSGLGGSATKRSSAVAPIGVDAAVMVERPLARRGGGAGEVERAQPAAARPAMPTTFTTFGSVRSCSCTISPASVPMSTSGSSERPRAPPRSPSGEIVGKSPCTFTTTSWRRSGIELAERLEDAVGAGGVVGARQHDLGAGALAARRRSPRNRRRPRPGRCRPRAPAPPHARSSAARRCRRAACSAGGSRPGAPG